MFAPGSLSIVLSTMILSQQAHNTSRSDHAIPNQQCTSGHVAEVEMRAQKSSPSGYYIANEASTFTREANTQAKTWMKRLATTLTPA